MTKKKNSLNLFMNWSTDSFSIWSHRLLVNLILILYWEFLHDKYQLSDYFQQQDILVKHKSKISCLLLHSQLSLTQGHSSWALNMNEKLCKTMLPTIVLYQHRAVYLQVWVKAIDCLITIEIFAEIISWLSILYH